MKKNKLFIAALATSVLAMPNVFASADQTQISIKDKISYKATSATNTIDLGDEICLDTECFYVLDSNSSTTSMLSKYNLAINNIQIVGNGSSSEGEDHIVYIENPTGAEVTYLQNSKFIGGVGGLGYSKLEDIEANGYLTTYSNKLKEKAGITPTEVRIPDANDMHYIDCDVGGECNDTNTPEWAHSTNYLISAVPKTSIGTELSGGNYWDTLFPGLRPVVEIDTASLGIVNVAVKDVENGSVNVGNDGENVNIELYPNEGYELDSISATGADGNKVNVTKVDDTHYTISIKDITSTTDVSVIYKKIGTSNSTEDKENASNIKENIENPETLDNISIMTMLFEFSLLGVLATLLHLKKRNN